MLSRRQFLGIAGGSAAVAAVGGAGAWKLLVDDRVHRGAAMSGPGDRVLVVVQLSGGNDGLDTLIPTGDGRYHDLRPSLAVAEADVVALGGLSGYGLHPALAPLAPWWDRGRLAMVEGVGFPGQSRSHFAALDTWWRGTPDHAVRTGWLGRWLDQVGDPTDPLRAITLGAGSPALIATRAHSTVVIDPAGFSLKAPPKGDLDRLTKALQSAATPLSPDATLAAAQLSVPATLDAVTKLGPALKGDDQVDPMSDPTNPSSAPADDTTTSAPTTSTTAARGVAKDAGRTLSSTLDVAARLIGLRLGTQVIVVTAGGFDTHANQAQAHPALLAELAAGLDRFLAKIDAQGQADQVLVMTTSEFGRRAAENGSGTDHGEASVHFVAGAPVAQAQVVGNADLGQLDQGDVAIGIDTRSLYAAALDWLGGPTDEILGGTYDRHSLLRT